MPWTLEGLRICGGWPRGIVRVLQQVWSGQCRWVSWAGHTSSSSLFAGYCTPQGCPFGPLALAAWMASGVRFVQSLGHVGFTRCYMDDRSFAASSAESLVAQVSAWEAWSKEVGLRESWNKAQLTAVQLRGRTKLRQVYRGADRWTASPFWVVLRPLFLVLLVTRSVRGLMLLSGRSSSFLWFGLGFWSFIGSLGLMVSPRSLLVGSLACLLIMSLGSCGRSFVLLKVVKGLRVFVIWRFPRSFNFVVFCLLCALVDCVGMPLRLVGPRYRLTLMGWFHSRGYSLLSPWKWSLGSSVTEVCLNGSMPPQGVEASSLYSL